MLVSQTTKSKREGGALLGRSSFSVKRTRGRACRCDTKQRPNREEGGASVVSFYLNRYAYLYTTVKDRRSSLLVYRAFTQIESSSHKFISLFLRFASRVAFRG